MSSRVIADYDPEQDLAQKHPQWSVRLSSLHGMGEIVDIAKRLILIDSSSRGDDYAYAHAVAHLDLGHITRAANGEFTAQQEADAHWLALIRLDRKDDRERA